MIKSTVFVLYTGGTFGMRPSENGSLSPSSWDEIISYLPSHKDRNFFEAFDGVEFTFTALEDVVDSSLINPTTWKQIAQRIEDVYHQYDGFIIIHGTDTLAYTASALSFVFRNLCKPVVLTGAQLSIFHPRTDGVVNLSNAIYIAAYKAFNLPRIDEVLICFNDYLIRGNRAVKSSTNDFEGFSSPNFPNIGSLEQEIKINTELLLENTCVEGLELATNFSDKIVNVTVFPGYNVTILNELVIADRLDGIVLKTFGSGNLPTSADWQTLIENCAKHNVIILATTQCPNGSIEIGRYEASNVLQNEIVIDGKDLTSEAALTKLMWVCGNYSFTKRLEFLKQNLRGEYS